MKPEDIHANEFYEISTGHSWSAICLVKKKSGKVWTYKILDGTKNRGSTTTSAAKFLRKATAQVMIEHAGWCRRDCKKRICANLHHYLRQISSCDRRRKSYLDKRKPLRRISILA